MLRNYELDWNGPIRWPIKITKESEHHKKYYDRRMRCMSLRLDDLVLVHVKAPTGDHKIADQ